ncbi:hypothetical protein ACT4UM_06230, partial [Bacillus sp. SS-TM]
MLLQNSQIHAVEDEVRQAKTMDRDIVTHAMKQSVAKLNPKVMIKNPIMFVYLKIQKVSFEVQD